MGFSLLEIYQTGLRGIGIVSFSVAALHVAGMLSGLPDHVIAPTLVAELICFAIGVACAVPLFTPDWLARPGSAGIGSALAGGSILLWFLLTTACTMALVNLGLGPEHWEGLREVYRVAFLGIVGVGVSGAVLGAQRSG